MKEGKKKKKKRTKKKKVVKQRKGEIKKTKSVVSAPSGRCGKNVRGPLTLARGLQLKKYQEKKGQKKLGKVMRFMHRGQLFGQRTIFEIKSKSGGNSRSSLSENEGTRGDTLRAGKETTWGWGWRRQPERQS